MRASPVTGGFVDSCVRLYETGKLPTESRDRLYGKLVELVPGVAEQDASKWKQYA